MTIRRWTFRRLCLVVLVFLGTAAAAVAQPDPRQMSGIPRPEGDMAPGSVSVRVIRGSFANPVQGHQVDLTVGGATKSATTNEVGRAEFSGLAPGTSAKAVAVVDGERLESQEFTVPPTGGIRLMLVATGGGQGAPTEAPAQPPAQPGVVILGDQTRFVFEMGDDALTGFYLLHVLNTARTPVQAPDVVVELPADAVSATVMEGSSPQGTVAGKKIIVKGPFAPGGTQVQVAFTLPYSGGTLSVAQRLPVPLTQVTLLVQRVGQLQVTSPQAPQQRDISAQADTYILAQGPGMRSGDTLSMSFSGLPHAPLWPRNVALALAAAILMFGIWASVRPGRAAAMDQQRRSRLTARREKLFAELTAIEEQQQAGTIDPDRYSARRRELVASLERVYAELDEEAAA